MPTIEVQTAQLVDSAARIDAAVAIAEQVASAQGRLGGEASAAGSAAAGAAIRSFLDRWRCGLSCLNNDAQHLSYLLRGAAAAYDSAEQKVTAAEEIG